MSKLFLLFLMKSGIILSVLYAFYWLFLHRLSFHSLKRYFLLFSIILSISLPFVQFSFVSDHQFQNINQFILIEEELSQAASQLSNEVPVPFQESTIPINTWIFLVYLGIISALLIRSTLELLKIWKIKTRSKLIYSSPYKVYQSESIKHSFSILYHIFIQSKQTAYEKDIIIKHEQAHILKGHTLDLILCELFVLLQWFNPFIYFIRKAIKEVHEYEADNYIINGISDSIEYQQLLLRQVELKTQMTLTSSFNSFTLKRLKMMTQQKSKTRKLLALILIIPIIAFLTLSFNKASDIQSSFNKITNTETFPQIRKDISSTEYRKDTIITIPEGIEWTFKSDSLSVIRITGNIDNPVNELRLKNAICIFDNYEYRADSVIYYHYKRQIHLFGNIRKCQRVAKAEHTPSICPVDTQYRIGAKFGPRVHPLYNTVRQHNGVDIIAPEGTNVYATADGEVVILEDSTKGSSGIYIIINHGGIFSTMYSHLSERLVKDGQEIKRGDIIGKVGNTGRSTGPHLHYEVMKNGNNVDPEEYFLK